MEIMEIRLSLFSVHLRLLGEYTIAPSGSIIITIECSKARLVSRLPCCVRERKCRTAATLL